MFGCSLGRGFEQRDGGVVDPGCHLRTRGHPPGEVGFETVLVDVAGVVFFADVFHDAVGEVVLSDHVHEALGAVIPDFAAVCLFQIKICS